MNKAGSQPTEVDPATTAGENAVVTVTDASKTDEPAPPDPTMPPPSPEEVIGSRFRSAPSTKDSIDSTIPKEKSNGEYALSISRIPQR